MTDNNKWPRKFHVLVSGLTINLGDHRDPRNGVYYRGQTFEVDEAAFEQTLDKSGNSWVDMTDEQQEARWGHVKFGEGELPDGIELGDDDPLGFQFKVWMRETQQANLIADPAARAQALKAIRERHPEQYGSTQRTLREY